MSCFCACISGTSQEPQHFIEVVEQLRKSIGDGESADARERTKTFVITGANSGIGKVCTQVLSKFGCSVIMLCRREEAARVVIDEITQDKDGGKAPTFVQCDMCDLASVETAAKEVSKQLAGAGGLDGLLLNAGVLGGDLKTTKDGLDRVLQTNFVAHVLLTRRLWSLLEENANAGGDPRLVSSTSITRFQDTLGMVNPARIVLEEGYFKPCSEVTGLCRGNGPQSETARYAQTKASSSLLL